MAEPVAVPVISTVFFAYAKSALISAWSMLTVPFTLRFCLRSDPAAVVGSHGEVVEDRHPNIVDRVLARARFAARCCRRIEREIVAACRSELTAGPDVAPVGVVAPEMVPATRADP